MIGRGHPQRLGHHRRRASGLELSDRLLLEFQGVLPSAGCFAHHLAPLPAFSGVSYELRFPGAPRNRLVCAARSVSFSQESVHSS